MFEPTAALRTAAIALVGIAALMFSIAANAELRASVGGADVARDGFCRIAWPDGREWLMTELTVPLASDPIVLADDGHRRCAAPGATQGQLYRVTLANDSRGQPCQQELATDGNCGNARVSGGSLTGLGLDRGIEGVAIWTALDDVQRTPLVTMLAGPVFFLMPVLLVFGFGLAAWREWGA